MIPLPISTVRKPQRRNTGGIAAFMVSELRAPAKVIEPEAKADMPIFTCSMIAMR